MTLRTCDTHVTSAMRATIASQTGRRIFNPDGTLNDNGVPGRFR
jgi:hypothetical protein